MIDLTAFDHVPVGVLLIRQDYRVVYWNRCLEQWTGRSRKVVLGQDVRMFAPRLAGVMYQQRLAQVFEVGAPVVFSAQMHHHIVPSQLHDGEARIQHTVVTAIPDDESDRYHALFTLQDVTESTRRLHEYKKLYADLRRESVLRQEAERALRVSEERYRIVSELSFDYAYSFLIAPDGSLKPEWVTDTFEQVTGFTVEESETRGGWARLVHPDDFVRTRDSVQVLLLSEQRLLLEYRIITRDGTVKTMQAMHQSQIHPETGQAVRIYGYVRDITTQKQTEQALADQQYLLSEVTRTIPGFVFIIDLETFKLRYFNDQILRLMGYASEELERLEDMMTLVDFVHPDDAWMVSQGSEKLHGLQDQEIRQFSIRIKQRDGTWRWVDLYETAFKRTADGTLSQVLGVAYDATARMESEQHALNLALKKEQVRVLAEFVRETAHDLRTPLSVMNTSLYLLGKTSDPVKRQQRVTLVQEQVSHLTRIVQELQQMVALEVKQSLELVDTDIPALVKSVLVRLQSKYQSTALAHSVIRVEGDVPLVAIDRFELERALVGVIENAVLYSHDKGCIEILMKQQGDLLMIAVKDDGIGIKAEDIPNIFQRFYKADKARPMNRSGTGIGLTMVKRIIDLHQGHIEVESEVNVGSIFRLFLPIGAP